MRRQSSPHGSGNAARHGSAAAATGGKLRDTRTDRRNAASNAKSTADLIIKHHAVIERFGCVIEANLIKLDRDTDLSVYARQ